MTSELSGKIVLITGATGGIGSSIAEAYASAGANVILGYNSNRDKAAELCQTLSGNGHTIKFTPILDSHALTELAEDIRSTFGQLDILVNNAGMTCIVPHDDLDGLDDTTIDTVFSTNFRGAFACVRAFRSLLETNKNGLVINISSIAGTTAVGSDIAYCASKAAMNAMTLSLARALAPKIRVVSISPGWVAGEYASRADPAYLQEQIDKTSLSRIADATDVANAAVAFATTLTFSSELCKTRRHLQIPLKSCDLFPELSALNSSKR